MQIENALLDGVDDDEPIDRHRPALTNAVGAVGGLVLDRRVPPRVEVDDVVCSRQIKACATRLETNQEKIPAPTLERRHALRTLLGGYRAINVLIAYAMLIQRLADFRQMAGELAEHQGLVAVAQHS